MSDDQQTTNGDEGLDVKLKLKAATLVLLWQKRWVIAIGVALLTATLGAAGTIIGLMGKSRVTETSQEVKNLTLSVQTLTDRANKLEAEVTTMKSVLFNNWNFLGRKMSQQRTEAERQEYQRQIDYIQHALAPPEPPPQNYQGQPKENPSNQGPGQPHASQSAPPAPVKQE